MNTFHVFLITIFFSPRMSLKKSPNLTCDVPKSLLFEVTHCSKGLFKTMILAQKVLMII